MTWDEFLLALRAAGGSTDMQTSKTGRYPWLFHFCRGQESTLVDVIVYARTSDYRAAPLASPPRDWRTCDAILADYAALAEHGGRFNDTREALEARRERQT